MKESINSALEILKDDHSIWCLNTPVNERTLKVIDEIFHMIYDLDLDMDDSSIDFDMWTLDEEIIKKVV